MSPIIIVMHNFDNVDTLTLYIYIKSDGNVVVYMFMCIIIIIIINTTYDIPLYNGRYEYYYNVN